MSQHDVSAREDRFDGLHGLLHDQPDAHRRGEMKDHVGPLNQIADHGLVQHGIDDERHVRPVDEMRHIRRATGRQIVEQRHRASVTQQAFGKMTAK